MRRNRGLVGGEAGHISIHAPRMRCDEKGTDEDVKKVLISIHAPRMRCDAAGVGLGSAVKISIHAPRMRCDCLSCICGDRRF